MKRDAMSSPTMQPMPTPGGARLVYADSPEADRQIQLGEEDAAAGRFQTHRSAKALAQAIRSRRSQLATETDAQSE
jgi:hypothetical protein